MSRIPARLLFTVVFTAVTALLGACSTTPTPVFDYKQDYDFSGVKKIGFYDESGQISGDNPMQLSDMQIERIDTALSNILTSKGFTVVDDPADADLLISWHLGTQNKQDVQTYTTPSYGMGYGVGYGRYNAYARYNCWSCYDTDVQVRDYTEGTFIIDMIDPAMKKSVWRSVTQSKLKSKQDESQERYDRAAALVLGGFPPQTGAP
ncbi:DUF4136 domain-containing protein [Haliea sp. E17]|uniref:DUF4136 domain-containing protein n=1 Tax=Haliea sp. E17 TaxID=3401576 RepID=UPI003AAA8CE4